MESTVSTQQLEDKVSQLTADLQHSSILLSRSEQDLQQKALKLQQVDAELMSCLASLAQAEQTVQHSSNHDQRLLQDQQQHRQERSCDSCPEASHDEAGVAATAAAAAQVELEMLREKLHDSVELLDEAEKQLRSKAAEVDESKSSLHDTQQELMQTQQQLQEAQLLLEEHAELLQQHNLQLLQAQEEVHVAESRYLLMLCNTDLLSIFAYLWHIQLCVPALVQIRLRLGAILNGACMLCNLAS